MIKKLILLTSLSLTTTQCFAQAKVSIKLEKDYTVEGVIFPEDYSLKFKVNDLSGRFTLSDDDVRLCEQYLLLNRPDVKYPKMSGFYASNKLKGNLKTYKRQYLGVINSAKDSIVIVQLLDFKNKREAGEHFSGWEKEFILGFGGFYEFNIKRLKVNLSKLTVSVY